MTVLIKGIKVVLMAWYTDLIKRKNSGPEKKDNKTEFWGSSGTEIYAGHLREEYLGELLDSSYRYDIFDRMERSDSTIAMCLRAFEDTLLSSRWTYAPKEGYEEEDPDVIEQIDFMESIFDSPKIREFLNNAVSFGKHGYCLFERVFSPVEKGGKVYLAPKFKLLSPRTIDRWITDSDGKFLGIYQQSSNDDPHYGFIPVDRLVHFANRKRGNNFEGISLIRPCYGPFIRKNTNYDNIAVGNRLMALPFLKIYDNSVGKLDKEQVKLFSNRLASRYDEDRVMMHLFFPKGVTAEELKQQFDPMKLYACNGEEDVQIIRSFCANFLMLGKGAGSYALGNTLAKFFTRSIENNAKDIDILLDKDLVNKCIEINFGKDKEVKIHIEHSEISKEGGKEFATAISALLSSGGISHDEKLEGHLRRRYELPEIYEDENEEDTFDIPIKEDEEINQEIDEENNEGQRTMRLSRSSFTDQAQRSVKRIEILTKQFQTLYETETLPLIDKKINILRKHFKKNKGTQKLFSIKPGDLSIGTRDIESVLYKLSGATWARETQDIEAIFDREKKIIQNLDPSPSQAARMLKTIIATDVKGLMDIIDNVLVMEFWRIAETAEGELAVTATLTDVAVKKLKTIAPKKASVVPSKTVSNARRSAFIKEGGKIVSYTLINPSPKTKICQYLAGKTVNIENYRQYQTPLHYNCKSVWSPNLSTFSDNPPVERIAPGKGALDSIENL